MKRYAEYKDSGVPWIGEIPTGWEVKKLKYIGEAIIGLTYSPDDVCDKHEGTLVLRSSNIQNGKLVFIDNVFVNKEITEKLIVKIGDILICSRNGSRELIGKNAIIDENCMNYSFGAFMTVFRTKYYHFIYHVFNSFIFKYLAGSFLTSTVNQLTTGNLNNMMIPFPPLQTQQSISDYLDHKTAAIDSLIEDKQKLIELLKEKRQAVISEAVTKGLDKNAKMKDSGIEWIGEIPEDWKRTKLKNLLSIPITDGPHETPEILDDGIPFISAEAIKNLKIDFNLKRGYISMDNHLKFCKKCKPEYGDIFMIKSGATTGNVAMVETYDEFSIWSPLALIRNNPNIIHNKYLFYYLQSRPFRLQVELFWSFGTQQNIGMGVLGNLYLSYPETDVQIEIVSYLNTKTAEIDNLVDDITEQIEKLKEYRQAIISEAVTGKVAI